LEFLTLIKSEVEQAAAEAKAVDKKLGIRLNVFSDIPWEQAIPWMFKANPTITFYDYTKNAKRVDPSYGLPANYHLTFSASERSSDDTLKELLANGTNVAMVADKIENQVPKSWFDFPVFDGDQSDFRPADPKGVIVFLKPKGRARTEKLAPRGKFIRTSRGFALANSN